MRFWQRKMLFSAKVGRVGIMFGWYFGENMRFVPLCISTIDQTLYIELLTVAKFSIEIHVDYS
jgi:hypothetical protein